MSQMTGTKLSLIVIRLMTIFLIVELISAIPYLASLPWVGFTSLPLGIICLYILILFASIMIPIILWCLAPKIAKRVAGTSDGTLQINVTNTVNITSALFSTAGVAIFVLIFPETIAWLFKLLYVLKQSDDVMELQRPLISNLLPMLFQLILSILLIFGAKRIAKFIKK
jgi:hypothetical protein